MVQDAGTILSFCGQPLSVEELTFIQGLAEDFSSLGRTEIANTVCELLQWVRPTGKLKTVECRAFLESLQAEGLIRLPPLRPQRRSERAAPPATHVGAYGAPLEGSIKKFLPLQLELISSPDDQALWREWMLLYCTLKGQKLAIFFQNKHSKHIQIKRNNY